MVVKFNARPAAGAAVPCEAFFRQRMAHYQRSAGDVHSTDGNFSRARWICDGKMADSGSVSCRRATGTHRHSPQKSLHNLVDLAVWRRSVLWTHSSEEMSRVGYERHQNWWPAL